MSALVRDCGGCGRQFAQERRRGRPRAYCDDCRPNGNTPAQPLDLVPTPMPAASLDVSVEIPATLHPDDPRVPEVQDLIRQADALDREGEQMAIAAKAKRGEAAKLRAKAERIADAVAGVKVRTESALDRVRNDGLLAASGLASEDLPAGFVARDLAAALGIADVARASRLLAALEELGKVARFGDGWMPLDPDEILVRDYVVATREGSIGDMIMALDLPETTVAFYLDGLAARGVVEAAGGFFRYREAPNDAPRARPRRRPPELDPPAGSDAPKRGEPIFIEDHGQNAKPGGKHRAKVKRKARERQEGAREQRAAEQRRRAKGG